MLLRALAAQSLRQMAQRIRVASEGHLREPRTIDGDTHLDLALGSLRPAH